MFPRLTEVQLARVSRLGKRRSVKTGEVLFNQGDEDVHFYVILSGEMEIVFRRLGQPDVTVTHGPGGFTGEVSLLAGRRALVTARMHTDGEVVDIPASEPPPAADATAQRAADVAYPPPGGLITTWATLRCSLQNNAGTLRLMEFSPGTAIPTVPRRRADADAQSSRPVQVRRGDAVPDLAWNQDPQESHQCRWRTALGFNVAIDTAEVRRGGGGSGSGRALRRGLRRQRRVERAVLESNAPGVKPARARRSRITPAS
jgi:hypothetical protein